MENKKKLIFYMITILCLIFAIGLFLNKISARVALPIMFVLLGWQQLFLGVFITAKDKKAKRIFGIIFGILTIYFAVFMLKTYRYF